MNTLLKLNKIYSKTPPKLECLKKVKIDPLIENILQTDNIPLQFALVESDLNTSKIKSYFKPLYKYLYDIVDYNSKTIEKYRQLVTRYDTSLFTQYIAFIDQIKNNLEFFNMKDNMVNKLYSLIILKELMVQMKNGKDIEQLIVVMDDINHINTVVDYEKIVQKLLPLEDYDLESQLKASRNLFTIVLFYIKNGLKDIERLQYKNPDEIPFFKQYKQLFDNTLKNRKTERGFEGWFITADDFITFLEGIHDYDENSKKALCYGLLLIKEVDLYSEPVGMISFKYWLEFIDKTDFLGLNPICNYFYQVAKEWFVLNIITKIGGKTNISEETNIQMLDKRLMKQSTIISKNIEQINGFIKEVVTLNNCTNVDLMALNVFNNIVQELKTNKTDLLDAVVEEIETLGRGETFIETTDVPYDMERDLHSFINFMQVWNFNNNTAEIENNQQLMEFIFSQKH